MACIRHLSPAGRRLTLALFALVMLVRVLVPAGWMPVADAAGGHLALCDGMMAVQPAHGMHHGKTPMHHQGPSDHPCAFAGAVAAVDVPVLALPLPVSPVRHGLVPSRVYVAVGQGLAAPPPPPTGPPAFA